MHPSLLTAALLAASLAPLTAQSVVNEGPEPNDLAGTPTPITCGHTGVGAVDVADDEDAWTFAVSSTTTVQLTVTPGFAGGISDSRVELFDAAGTSIGFDDDSGDSLHPLLTMELAAGTYSAVVDGYSSATGSYTLDVICYAPNAPQCPSLNPIVEGPEPNQSTTTATPFAPCDEATGDLTSGDDDWYAITLANSTRCVFTTSAGPNNPLGDSRLELFDASGTNSLAFDDDGGPGLYSLLDVNLAAGTYFLNVDGYGSASGDYLVSFEAFAVLTRAAYTISGTACPDGSGGTMTLAERSNERPFAGSVFMLDVEGIPAGMAIAVLGFADLTPPVDLAIVGAPGCLQYTDIFLDLPLTVTGTSAEIQLAIPGNLPGLLGMEFNQQVAALAPNANTTGLVTSDFGEGTIGTAF